MAVDLDPSGAAAQHMPPVESASACIEKLVESIDDATEQLDDWQRAYREASEYREKAAFANGFILGVALMCCIVAASAALIRYTFREDTSEPSEPPSVQLDESAVTSTPRTLLGVESFAERPNDTLSFGLFDDYYKHKQVDDLENTLRELEDERQRINTLRQRNRSLWEKLERDKHNGFLLPNGQPLKQHPSGGIET